MEENKILTEEQLAEDWLRITVERFKKAIKRAGIDSDDSDTESLINSFRDELKRAGGGSLVAALIKFKLSGRFSDMGVGRGAPIGSQSAKASYYKSKSKNNSSGRKRRAKKWYSKTLAGQTYKLAELMADHFGVKCIQVIESSLKNVEINLDGTA